jgi:hypothetical protein
MPGENENHRNLSHHGLKEASGFVTHSNVGIGTEMAPGILGAPMKSAPHGSTDKLAPELGRHDRNLTTRDNPDLLKRGANRFPSGAR